MTCHECGHELKSYGPVGEVMWKAQEQVTEFMKEVAEQATPTKLVRVDQATKNLRMSLMTEELHELEMAMGYDDLMRVADNLCDLLYVVIGAAITYGMDLEPLFDEVHRANMAKKGGPQSSIGKQLKPEGWEPPDLAPILTRML